MNERNMALEEFFELKQEMTKTKTLLEKRLLDWSTFSQKDMFDI